MPSRARVFAVLLVLAVALGIKSGYPSDFGLDYQFEAGPPIDLLIGGHFGAFASHLPIVGPLSLYLRAPFVLAVPGNDLYTVFLAGAIPCVAALIFFAVALVRIARERGQEERIIGACVVLAVVNLATFRTMHWGHPEELLCAALAVGAALAALRSRPLLAGVLIGLAIATKLWALIALVPVLLAADRRQLRLFAAAVATAAAIYAPTAIASPQRFVDIVKASGNPQAFGLKDERPSFVYVTPSNVWWPVAQQRHGTRYSAHTAPNWTLSASHAVILLAVFPLTWLYRRRGRRPREDALALLALLLLLRCVLDPGDVDYYHAPFLLALATWEALGPRGRLPWATLIAAIGLGVAFFPYSDAIIKTVQAGGFIAPAYLLWALPLAVWLTLVVSRVTPAELRARRPWPSRAARASGPAAAPTRSR